MMRSWASRESIAILSKQILLTYVKRNIYFNNYRVTANASYDVVFVKDLASNVSLIHWWEMYLLIIGGAFSNKCLNISFLKNAN